MPCIELTNRYGTFMIRYRLPNQPLRSAIFDVCHFCISLSGILCSHSSVSTVLLQKRNVCVATEEEKNSFLNQNSINIVKYIR